MKMKIAQIQLRVSDDKEENLLRLSRAMDQLDPKKPDLVAVGEMFCCPYDTACFPKYAEPQGGPTQETLRRLAKDHGVWLSAGSVPERDGDRIYNTAYVFDRSGNIAAKHRKIHLFDVDISGGQYFRESDVLSAGNEVTVFDTEFGRIGLCICFDIRFPELARLMAQKGARLILVPAAFNQTTGPAHWEISFRARALDNQCFYAGTSTALDENASYHSYGHSILVSPWGEVLAQSGYGPDCFIHEIDPDLADRIREQLPLLKARRTDLYELRETDADE